MMKTRLIRILFVMFSSVLLLSACAEEYDDTADAGTDFLEANKTQAGVVVTASGLQYKVEYDNPYGLYPHQNSVLKIVYNGYFIDGTPFATTDSFKYISYSDLPVGMQEAVRRMKIGSKWRIWLPSDLAYGSDGLTNSAGDFIVDPNSAVYYDVQILDEY